MTNEFSFPVLQLGAATRLEGITPAAVVSLYNYVQFAEKKGGTGQQKTTRSK